MRPEITVKPTSYATGTGGLKASKAIECVAHAPQPVTTAAAITQG
jgi:hypothetical protein